MRVVTNPIEEKAAMTNSNQLSIEFPALKSDSTSRKIEVQFSGGEVTSDAGVLLLREVDKKLDLTKKFSKFISDSRNPLYVEHSNLDMLRQRVYSPHLFSIYDAELCFWSNKYEVSHFDGTSF